MQKLVEFYELNKHKPFQWGEWDCSIVARDWIEFATGKYFKLPKCKTVREYLKYDIESFLDNSLIKIDKAKTGDIVLFRNNIGLKTIGIKSTTDIILSPAKYGLVSVNFPLIRAWSV